MGSAGEGGWDGVPSRFQSLTNRRCSLKWALCLSRRQRDRPRVVSHQISEGSDHRRSSTPPAGAFRAAEIAVVGAGPGGSTAALIWPAPGISASPATTLATSFRSRNRPVPVAPVWYRIAVWRIWKRSGLSPPDEVVQRRLQGYVVHLAHGARMTILTKRMIAVYRGFGPLESAQRGIEGFDAWLLSEAIAAGVRFEPVVVNRIETGVDGEARLDLRWRGYGGLRDRRLRAQPPSCGKRCHL